MSKKIQLSGMVVTEYNTATFEQSDWLLKWSVLDKDLHGLDGMEYLERNKENRFFNPDLWNGESKMFLMEPEFGVSDARNNI